MARPCSISPKACNFVASASWALIASNSRASPTRCGTGGEPMGCSTKSSRGSCACSCRRTLPGRQSWAKCWSAIRSRASPIGRRRDMPRDATELAHRLAREAEAVCRHYLSNGRRVGNYWQGGDGRNAPGRSMFVRLSRDASGKRVAGKWTDAATGEHGDLLDVIRQACGLVDFRDVVAEARRFLNLHRLHFEPQPRRPITPTKAGSSESARRLFDMSEPLTGTIAEKYLRKRCITALHETDSLRFHPRCYYRPDAD